MQYFRKCWAPAQMFAFSILGQVCSEVTAYEYPSLTGQCLIRVYIVGVVGKAGTINRIID